MLVILENGFEVHQFRLIVVKNAIILDLPQLGMEGFWAATELYEFAKTGKFIEPKRLEILQELQLMESDGSIKDDVKNIVLCL